MNVAASQPGIFTLDSSGSGPGHVYIGTTLVNSANPAHPANLVTVFTTGLGPTTPPVSTNTQTPGNVLYNAAAVTATIGGVPAKVTFAGLVPGFVGLYQVNLQIPTLATGTYDLIVIAPTGLQSNTVPVPVVSP